MCVVDDDRGTPLSEHSLTLICILEEAFMGLMTGHPFFLTSKGRRQTTTAVANPSTAPYNPNVTQYYDETSKNK